MSVWKVIPGISRWLLSVRERGYTLQFRRRPPRFNGVVQSLTSPRNAQALRQEIGCLLEKGAVERVPPNELESGFYSRYFVVPKRDRGAPPNSRSQTHQQSALQTSVQDDNAETYALKDAYFHIQIAPHHRRFLRFALEGTAFQYSVLPFGLAQGERDTHPQLSGRLADFSSVLGHATQPHRLAAYSLGVLRAMCKHAKEHPRPESVHNISGSLHGLPGNESPPLAGTHGGHFVLPAPFQRRQLCSFEEISEAAGTHGVSFGSMSSGLITHAPVAAMA